MGIPNHPNQEPIARFRTGIGGCRLGRPVFRYKQRWGKRASGNARGNGVGVWGFDGVLRVARRATRFCRQIKTLGGEGQITGWRESLMDGSPGLARTPTAFAHVRSLR